VSGVGTIARGASSADVLRLAFNEAGVGAFERGPGAFTATITDAARSGSAVRFIGEPSTATSPGSLGATATIGGANVLTIMIRDSDTANIEPIIVTGLGIAVSASAAVGPIHATLGDFTGSLVGGAVDTPVVALGTVTAGP